MPKTSHSVYTSSASPVESKRLHITPLTEVLLPKLLGNQLPLAKDISFHQLPSFPNRAYGFVTLPSAEAAMVKKKLNGTILRGEKVAVEDARPDARNNRFARETAEAAEAGPDADTPGSSLRKRKRQDGVIAAAVELPKNRKVKRGWTEPKVEIEAKKIKEKKDKKGSKDEKKSKKLKAKPSVYTDQSEGLFQIAVPEGKISSDKKGKQDCKKLKKGKEIVTIHEFEKTTKHPSYLRQTTTDKGKVQEYDEEKGWMDEGGNVVEAANKRTRPIRSRVSKQGPAARSKEERPEPEDEDDETSSSGSSSEDDQDDNSSEAEAREDDARVVTSPTVEVSEAIPTKVAVSITESSPVAPHPLETLFKKPKPLTDGAAQKTDLKVNTDFTFFGNDDMDEDTESPKIEKSLETPGLPALKRRGLPNLSIPVTPYNPRDMQWRSQRSAAPTPDTAAPSKSAFGDPFGMLAGSQRERDEDIEEENEDEEDGDVMQGIEGTPSTTPPIKPEGQEEGEQSEWAKWFYENRGENNRAWKKRKRDAMREQRRIDNRRRRG